MNPRLRSLALPIAFVIGFLIPQAHVLQPVVPWFVRFMIYMISLQCHAGNFRLHWSQIFVFCLNLLIPLSLCELLTQLGYPVWGQIAFFTAISPTGTAAPALMSFLGGSVEYVFTSFMINTIGVAAFMPLLIPLIAHSPAPGLFTDVAWQMLTVVGLPIMGALLTRWIFPRSENWTSHCKQIVFLAWVTVVGIICSSASHYIRTTPSLSWAILLTVGGLTFLICFLNFSLGRLVGEKGLRREASQSLGQKNVSLTIHLALLYANPLVALGPTLYVLWHNLWNSWQLQAVTRAEVQEKTLATKPQINDVVPFEKK